MIHAAMHAIHPEQVGAYLYIYLYIYIYIYISFAIHNLGGLGASEGAPPPGELGGPGPPFFPGGLAPRPPPVIMDCE